MTPQKVCEALKAIGPHVEYEEKDSACGRKLHTWTISEFPKPRQSRGKMAMLCMTDDIDISPDISEILMEEGRARYEASA